MEHKHGDNKHHPHKKHDDLGDELKEGLKEGLEGAKDVFNDVKLGQKINWKNEFNDAWGILTLNKTKMNHVATRKTSVTPALLFALVGSIAAPLGTYLALMNTPFYSIGDMFIGVLYYVVNFLVSVFLLDIIANSFFKGKGSFGQLFKVLGYAYTIMLPAIIIFLIGLSPSLVGILGLWYLVVMFKSLQEIYKLSNLNTVLTLIISVVVIGILMYIVQSTFGFGVYDFYM